MLRGRGGTENAATVGHAVGTRAVLIDDNLHPVSAGLLPQADQLQIAAIGLGDDEPVNATTALRGLSRRPLAPVHPHLEIAPSGDWSIYWTRRARGQWAWNDGVGTSLIEENEAYQIGLGSIDQPIASWEVERPELVVDAAAIDSLIKNHTGEILWVRQLGTHAPSLATKIAILTTA